MKLLHAARSGVLIGVLALIVVPSIGAGASLTACGESGSCTRLRDDTFATKQIWGACNPRDPAPCVKVAGNTKDCTGVLSCDFAVNRTYRLEAERAVLTIAQQSQGCYLCATPNCIAGDLPICEPESGQCLVVTSVFDAGSGTPSPQPGPPEASIPPEASSSDGP